MDYYVGLVDRSRDGAYGIVIPDCPGCHAMGWSVGEAMRHVEEIMVDWTADRSERGLRPPSARTVEAIRADPEFAVDFAEGCLVVLVPLPPDEDGAERGGIRLIDPSLFDRSLLEQIDAAADRCGMTRATFLAAAAREKIATAG